jgi:hypothetical protein
MVDISVVANVDAKAAWCPSSAKFAAAQGFLCRRWCIASLLPGTHCALSSGMSQMIFNTFLKQHAVHLLLRW